VCSPITNQSPITVSSTNQPTNQPTIQPVSEVPQGLLRWLGGDILRGGAEIALTFCLCISATSVKGAQGVPLRVGGGITRGDAVGALAGSRVTSLGGASLKETRGGTLVGSGALAVASL